MTTTSRFLAACLALMLTLPLILMGLVSPLVAQQPDFEREPIHYDSQTPQDPVHQLLVKLKAGETKLDWDPKHGWLPSLLSALEVPESSQTLVFSKTSLQIRRISPARPRALYFNDNVYIGWVQQGDFVELAAVDPKQGAQFYKLQQKPTATPTIVRDGGECMACHATARTQRVPGFLVRSVFPQADGQPNFRMGTLTSDHTTPLRDRFGGWYVTGTHGSLRHRGNTTTRKLERADPRQDEEFDLEAGANRTTLPDRVRKASYLTDTSDIVALMVLEHQTQMHNWITRASYTTRKAKHQQQTMNRILERPTDHRSESFQRRIDTAAEKLLKYLLFCDEFVLTDTIQGNSSFAKQFVAQGPQDRQGRSLRDLDLKTRMFRYPCSFLIYSESFLALPAPVLTQTIDRLKAVLTGEDQSDTFAHLSALDRANILAILRETHGLFATPLEEQTSGRSSRREAE